MTQFRRILVKLSGEALMAPDGYWLDPQTLSGLAQDLADATRKKVDAFQSNGTMRRDGQTNGNGN